MKKMKKILAMVAFAFFLTIGGLLAVASRQPDTYRVVRTGTFEAQPADVFPFLNDLSRWNDWSPWKDLDPEQRMATSENPVGKGAWFTWEGNSDAGKGKMTMIESVENQKVVHELHFIEPFEDTATVTFELAGSGSSTQMTWTMDGKMNLLSKAMCLFVSMDQMIGGDFEKGMKKLQPLVEAQAKAREGR